MLDYKIINYKPKIQEKNGLDSYIDLMADTYRTDLDISCKPLIVNKYYVARPDLISFAVYGNDRYADFICKFNGISNPFELNEDDFLLIPNIDDLQKMVKKNIIPSDFISETEDETIEKNSKDNYQKQKNEIRSPNEQVIGDSIYTIDKSMGIVFY